MRYSEQHPYLDCKTAHIETYCKKILFTLQKCGLLPVNLKGSHIEKLRSCASQFVHHAITRQVDTSVEGSKTKEPQVLISFAVRCVRNQITHDRIAVQIDANNSSTPFRLTIAIRQMSNTTCPDDPAARVYYLWQFSSFADFEGFVLICKSGEMVTPQSWRNICRSSSRMTMPKSVYRCLGCLIQEPFKRD